MHHVSGSPLPVSVVWLGEVPWRYDAMKKLLSGVLGEFRFEMAAYIRTKNE